MSPVDFEALISLAVAGGGGSVGSGGGGSSGGDQSKVACETTLPAASPDLPAESFCLPADQEYEWMDRNAAPIYEREDSTKGPSNPKSSSHVPPAPSTSQRFSGNLKRKDPIIGLPRKLRVDHLGHSSRRTAPRSRALPRRKTAVPGSEPASPKVSCLGKILSDRERVGPRLVARKVGLFARFLRALGGCGGGRRRKSAAAEEEAGEEETKSPAGRRAAEVKASAEPPGLGAMRRFTSGRSWASMEADDVDFSGPLDPGLGDGVGRSEPLDGGLRARRGAGMLVGLECGKGSLDKVGPSSV